MNGQIKSRGAGTVKKDIEEEKAPIHVKELPPREPSQEQSNVPVPTTPSPDRSPGGRSAAVSGRGDELRRGDEPAGEPTDRPAGVPPQQPAGRTGVEDDVGQGTSTGGIGVQQGPSVTPQDRKRIGSFVEYKRHNTIKVISKCHIRKFNGSS